MRKLTAATLTLSLLGSALTLGAQEPPRSGPEMDRRVESILGRMTPAQKLEILGGVDGFFVAGVQSLGVPRMKMADGPVGVRNFGKATAFAAGIGLAATWNPELAARVGTELGRDARAKGVHFLLGPGVNIYRSPTNGRNFEYFGEDPFLAARIATGYIKGVQSQGVSATVKHFMGNNSEFDRHDTDSIIDERTMREIYLPTFEAAVKEAHVGAIMSSYNLVNGEHASQNKFLLTDVARKDWGFEGVMMSDWFGTYDGVGAANAGQDLEMPSGAHMNQKDLQPAIDQGKVSLATIDDKVRHILRTAARFGWLDREQTDLSIPRLNPQGRVAALAAAREGLVLLKNDSNLLPLDKAKVKTIAVIGPNAYPAVPVGGGSAQVEPFAAVSALEGLSNSLGVASRVLYGRGLPSLGDVADATDFVTAATAGKPGLNAEYFGNEKLDGAPVVSRNERHINFGRGSRAVFPDQTSSSRWTGYYIPKASGPHEIFVQSTGEDGGAFRLSVDDKVIMDNWTENRALAGAVPLTLDATPHKVVLEQHGRSQWLGGRLRLGIARRGDLVDPEAKKLAASADVVIVAAGFDPETESEGADRTFSLPLGQDELIREIAAINKNTVVVLTSGGGVDMTGWVDNVPSLIQAWYSGQEGGTALAEVLFGEVNPSGRLPVTFERHAEDNPTRANYFPTAGTKRVEYKEGVFVGYRGYERNKTKPLFAFGHGLSYTTFAYSNLQVKPVTDGGASGAGLRYEVSFDVRNTGSREGADVPQVYVGDSHAKVPRPAKELKGFAKVTLRPGESKRVAVLLDARSFSYYDVTAKQWRADPGAFEVLVGQSSDRIDLRGTITLAAVATLGK
ncbi:MAG: glycoside hydrolase family 3 C-terminal domain-containing protein [Vicinamibacteria bacterium]